MKLFKHLTAILLCALLLLSIIGCGGVSIDPTIHYEDNDEDYEIKYYLPIQTDGISQSFPDMDMIEDAINEIIYPKIKARVRFVQLLYFNYNEQMTQRIASNETFDLCYTSPTINYYYTNIKRKAFLPINTLLEDYGPHIKEQVPDYAWKQAQYTDGYIYGVVNQQIIPRTDAALLYSYDDFNEFLATNGYDGYTYQNIYEYILDQNIHPYDILEEYVGWLKKNNKGLGGKMGAVNVADGLQTRYHWDDLGTGMQVPGVISCDATAQNVKVFNQFTTEEFKSDIQRAARYYSSGLMPKSIKTGDMGTDMSNYDVPSLTTWKPNDIRTNIAGNKGGALRLGNPYYYISYILGTMTAISSTCKNPARVMKFLDLMWTDSEIMNLLVFGVEGEHFEKTDSEDGLQIQILPNSRYTNYTMTWAYASEFLDGVYYIDQYDENPYLQSKEVNEQATLNAAIGFHFDESRVSAQIAACKAITSTYLTEFSTGQHGDNIMTIYDTFIQKLKDAGMDRIVEEKQRQLTEWLQSK